MNTKYLLVIISALFGGTVAIPAADFVYRATLLDGANPANGKFDLKFTFFEKPSGGQPIGVSLTSHNFQVSRGLVNTVLMCGVPEVDGKRRWVEVAVRPAGSSAEFTPTRARVEQCTLHPTGAGKPCDARCQFTTLGLETNRLPFSLDATKPARERGVIQLPVNSAPSTTSPATSVR